MRKFVPLWIALAILSFSIVRGQDSAFTLTVSVPAWGEGLYDSDFFGSFYDAHPGVNVVVKVDQSAALDSIPYPWELSNHLAAVQNYVSQADVLYVDDFGLSVESARSGYWLNLLPLVNADGEISADHFLPPVWESFQWDNGFWAIPHAFSTNVLGYSKSAFDRAGLSYPDAKWTVDDFVKAIDTLTERDATGKATRLGFYDGQELLRSLLGTNYWEDTSSGIFPRLDDPNLAALLDTWGAAWYRNAQDADITTKAPLVNTSLWLFDLNNSPFDSPMTIAPLPGNLARVRTNGFAISAGTLNPPLAYALAKYMAKQSGIRYADRFNSRPAWETPTEIPLNLSPENRQIVASLMPHALGNQDMLYRNYVNWAMSTAWQEGIPAAEALRRAQESAQTNLEQASKVPNKIDISTPLPTAMPDLAAAESTLQFGISRSVLPNPQLWEQVASEFADADAQISRVMINTQGFAADDYQSFMAQNDCYYLTYSAVDTGRVSDYLPLDPMVNADPNFNPDDFIPGALSTLQLDGTTWGYPLNVEPVVLQINIEALQKANFPIPSADWSTNDFSDLLMQLKSVEDQTGLSPLGLRPIGHSDMLSLIAAYGGLLIDDNQHPVQFDFTHPQTVTAVRQVLDLAKQNLIDYQPLGRFAFPLSNVNHAINVIPLAFGSQNTAEQQLVNFPKGNEHSVFSLANVGGLYINKNGKNPDGCYRWFQTMVKHPELLQGTMPASLAALTHPGFLAVESPTTIALFRTLVDVATNPNSVIFYNRYRLENWFITIWLGKAFDAYVLEGADLDTRLLDAQAHARDFMACVESNSTNAHSPVASDDRSLECLAKVDEKLYSDYQNMIPHPAQP